MNADIQTLISDFFGQAISTIMTEVVLLGLIGAVLSVFGVLLFKIAMNAFLGGIGEKWVHTWKAVWVLAIVLLPVGGMTIGAGEGLIRGCERALRESEFGQKTVPAIAQQSVYLYAAVYFADPKTLQDGKLTDLAVLGKLDEVRGFANGSGELETARLEARMQELEGRKLSEMARGARDDFARLSGGLGDDFAGLQTASNVVLDFAVTPPEVDGLTAKDAVAPLFDVQNAAGLDGNPATVTRDELAQHLREEVAIPGLIAPIRLFVRPWQYGAAIIMALLVLLLGLTRVAAADGEEQGETGQS